jgi:hypothetical protein
MPAGGAGEARAERAQASNTGAQSAQAQAAAQAAAQAKAQADANARAQAAAQAKAAADAETQRKAAMEAERLKQEQQAKLIADQAAQAAQAQAAAQQATVDKQRAAALQVSQQFADALAQRRTELQNQPMDASMQMLQTAATGAAPSQAEMLMTQRADQIAREQMGMMYARGGYNPALARQAMQTGAQAQQVAAGDAATMRAQEMQASRLAFAQAMQNRQAMMAEQENALFGMQGQAIGTGLQTGLGYTGQQTDLSQLAAQSALSGGQMQMAALDPALQRTTASQSFDYQKFLQAMQDQAALERTKISAQLAADAERAKAASQEKSAWIGAGATVLGSLIPKPATTK